MLLSRRSLVGLAVAGIASIAGSAHAQTQFVTVGGGTTGGAFYVIAAGMARLIEKNVPNVKATSRATSATIENTRLLGRKQVEFALAADNGPWAAANSKAPFENEKYDNIRYIATGYTSPFHIIVPADSPVKTVADLADRRVGVLAGITAQDWFPRVAEVYGVKDKFRSFNLRAGELMDSLRDGNIDVAVYSGSAPTASISDLLTSKPMRFVPIDPAKAREVAATHPFFFPYPIKKGIYPGVSNDVPSIGNAILFVTHKDVSDALVYAVTKTLMENRAELTAMHPSAGEFNTEHVGLSMVVPMHPGAKRYFDEKGIKYAR